MDRIWFVGTLTAITVSTIYIFWGPSPKQKRRKEVIPGLENLGNSCFLNAVLQAVASWSPFLNWLKEIASEQQLSSEINNYSLVGALYQTLHDLNTPNKDDVYTPMNVIEALRAKRWVITTEEQDAHELFHVLTTTLEEEILPHLSVLSLFEVNNVQKCIKFKDGDKHPGKIVNRYTYLQDNLIKYECPTRGLLASQLRCKICDYKYPICYDTFDSISLVIPNSHLLKSAKEWKNLNDQFCIHYHDATDGVENLQKVKLTYFQLMLFVKDNFKHRRTSSNLQSISNDANINKPTYSSRNNGNSPTEELVITENDSGHLRIEDCLKKYISCELVQDVNCDGCTKKQENAKLLKEQNSPCKSTFVKQLTIGKLPECLCFHIQRTVWLHNGMPVKCLDHVSFPEFLSMDDYVFHGNTNHKITDGIIYPWMRLIGGNLPDCCRETPMNTGNKTFKNKEFTIIDTFKKNSVSDLQYFNSTSENGISSRQNQNHLYILKAVIVHLGNVFSGHFITYRRSPVNQNQWFYISDTAVRTVQFSEVLHSSAYMLFYEKTTSIK